MNVGSVGTVVAAVAVSSIAASPALLLGGLAVLIQDDLRFGGAQLGIGVGAYFASGAVFAGPTGVASERMQPRTMARVGLAISSVALLYMGLFTTTWFELVGAMIIGGAGGSMAQMGASVLVARDVAREKLGLAFGISLAAIPLAAILAGLSVPTVGVTLGWRWPFIGVALLALGLAAILPDRLPRTPQVERPRAHETPRGRDLGLAAAVFLASAGGTSTTAFVVVSAVERGLRPAEAGLILAAGSATGLAVRVGAGYFADRWDGRTNEFIAGLLAVGAVGYVGLAISDTPALVVGSALLAFGGGWGWPGLALFAISRSHPVAPGRAFGLVLTGGMAGAVAGPIAFGLLAEHATFSASWVLMSVLAVAGVVSAMTSRQAPVAAW